MTLEKRHYNHCLNLLREQWPDEARRVEEAGVDHLAIVKTEAGEDNILYTCKGQAVPMHDPEGALKEAEKRFENQGFHQGLKTIFQYGLGAGYDYLAVKSWLKQDPDRLFVVLEDDFGLIQTFFRTQLADDFLSNPQVLLVPIESKIEAKEAGFPSGFEMLLHIGIRDTYAIVFSHFYEETKNSFCHALKQYLHMRIQDFVWLSAFNSKKIVKKVFNNLMRNLFSLPSMIRGSDLFQKFRGIPALICAAGPSIKDQLPRIKELKNRALLFGAGTGMNVLNTEGILPHFGCGIDPHRTSESRMLMNTAFSVPYFQTMHFNDAAARLIHGERLFFRGPESYGAVSWMLEALGLEDPIVHFNVSTTCACLAVAEKLRCGPVIFLGLDLSYTDQKRYPEGISAHPTDKQAETRFIEELPKKKMIPLTNSLGNRIFTRLDWISEGAYYSLYAKQHPALNIVNATVEGLQIQGVETISLEEAEKKYLSRSYDIDNWVHAEVVLATSLKVDHAQVCEVVAAWKKSLERGSALLRQMIEDLLDADGFSEEIGTEKYHQLKQSLKEEPIYRYLIKEVDFAFEKKRMRDLLFLRFHAHLLEKEERYQRKLITELYRLRYLYKFVEIHLKGIQKADLNKEEGESSVRKEAAAPVVDCVFDGNMLRIQNGELGIDLEDRRVPSNGEALLYDDEGWLKGRAYYKEGKLHGPSYFYGPNGGVLAEGWFFEDERQGINLQYYPSGRLYSVQRFKDGVQEGRQEFYYENGELKTACAFAKGVLHGKVELFFPDGKKKRILSYFEGKRHGKEQLWTSDGKLLEESEYDSGHAVGSARRWHPNGQLQSEKIVVDEEGHYDLRMWSEEGKLIAEKVYFPEAVSDDLIQSQKGRGQALERLKKTLKGLVDEQSK